MCREQAGSVLVVAVSMQSPPPLSNNALCPVPAQWLGFRVEVEADMQPWSQIPVSSAYHSTALTERHSQVDSKRSHMHQSSGTHFLEAGSQILAQLDVPIQFHRSKPHGISTPLICHSDPTTFSVVHS